MPPRITVEFLGDTKSLEQAFQRTGSQATSFERNVTRANTAGARSFDRLGRSASTSTGRIRGMSTAFSGLGGRSQYAGYRVQNLISNVQAISRESKSAAGSVNLLVGALGLFGVVGAGVGAVALGITKLERAAAGLAGKSGAGKVLGDTGTIAQMKALLLANQFGGQLGFADVAGPISSGLLTVQGLRSLRPRFTSRQAFLLAVGFAKETERQNKLLPRRVEQNPQQGRSFPQFLQPLTAAQQLKVSLANAPNNVTFLRQQVAADRRAIAFAGKQRNALKITNEEYVAIVQAYQGDVNATLGRLAAITARAKKAVTQTRLRLPYDLSGTFRPNDLSPFRSGILPSGRVSGSFQKLAATFEPPVGLRIAEARAGALGDDAGLVSILKRERVSAQKALRSGRLSALARIDAWNAIADINDRLKNTADGDISNFRKVGARALAKGLGLSGAAERTLIARLSQATVPASGSGAFGRPLVIQNDVWLDGHKVESAVTKRQQTRARRNPPQKRGPYAGPH